mmetsp:Transcript_100018/g.173571  ORF Transcript_100018/g.173571 Transcript_100018/m.173571 type:complete len:201 (+) Transcript_100018:385-987(+)
MLQHPGAQPLRVDDDAGADEAPLLQRGGAAGLQQVFEVRGEALSDGLQQAFTSITCYICSAHTPHCHWSSVVCGVQPAPKSKALHAGGLRQDSLALPGPLRGSRRSAAAVAEVLLAAAVRCHYGWDRKSRSPRHGLMIHCCCRIKVTFACSQEAPQGQGIGQRLNTRRPNDGCQLRDALCILLRHACLDDANNAGLHALL